MHPEVVIGEVETLRAAGSQVELVASGAQGYALVRSIEAPVPPWDRGKYDILIAVPAAYDDAGLDGFYLELPHTFRGGAHPRVNGTQVMLGARNWQLVSWHYPENRPWKRGVDSLESHITHCKGFFWNRGAVNAM